MREEKGKGKEYESRTWILRAPLNLVESFPAALHGFESRDRGCAEFNARLRSGSNFVSKFRRSPARRRDDVKFRS